MALDTVMAQRFDRRQLLRAGGQGLILIAFGWLVGCGNDEAPVAATHKRIGVLDAWTGEGPRPSDPLVEELANLGWKEGENLTVERRSFNQGVGPDPGEQAGLAAKYMTELLSLPVDALFTLIHGIDAAKEQTTSVPVLAMFLTDPVEAGYVASFASPGANITGTLALPPPLFRKQVQYLLEAFPATQRIAQFVAPDPVAPYALRESSAAARELQVEILALPIRAPEDIDAQLAAMANDLPDALLPGGGVALTRRPALVEFGILHKLPMMWAESLSAEQGALMSYSADIGAVHRNIGRQMDLVLRGARPQDLGIDSAAEFQFIINLKTAAAMGVTFPPSVLARATSVIQ